MLLIGFSYTRGALHNPPPGWAHGYRRYYCTRLRTSEAILKRQPDPLTRLPCLLVSLLSNLRLQNRSIVISAVSTLARDEKP